MSTETQHLGIKIEQERLRLRMLKRDLAAHFDMKQPSVTEMLQTGRLSKEKYQRLVDLNGRSLDWWFDIIPPAGALPSAGPQFAHSPAAPYNVTRLEPDPQPCTDAELLDLFHALPRAEKTSLVDELRKKAAFYSSALQELLQRQQATANH